MRGYFSKDLKEDKGKFEVDEIDVERFMVLPEVRLGELCDSIGSSEVEIQGVNDVDNSDGVSIIEIIDVDDIDGLDGASMIGASYAKVIIFSIPRGLRDRCVDGSRTLLGSGFYDNHVLVVCDKIIGMIEGSNMLLKILFTIEFKELREFTVWRLIFNPEIEDPEVNVSIEIILGSIHILRTFCCIVNFGLDLQLQDKDSDLQLWLRALNRGITSIVSCKSRASQIGSTKMEEDNASGILEDLQAENEGKEKYDLTSDLAAGARRNSMGTPAVGVAERRSSLGTPISTTTPRQRLPPVPGKPSPPTVESRRASLSNLSVRQVASSTPTELKRTSSGSKTSSFTTSSISPSIVGPSKSATPSARSSKPTEAARASKPSVVSSRGSVNPPSPSIAAKKKTATSSLIETRTRTSTSLDGGLNGLRKPGLSFGSSTKNTSSSLATDRISSLSNRRKSLTPDSKDSRLITLPQVEVKAGDDVRLDLRGQKVRSLDSSMLNLSPKLEFVYLRDNKLTTLVGIEILKKVKVLDLSFNEFKGPGFEPLGNCKGLQQLYLAGNQITSLSGLPELPNLEFLSVAQNKLKSLAMATQPRLQVLAASKNKISTLKGFPHLPVLEHLRLEENPILEMPHLEAAAILLVGPTLKKFNDRDLSIEEQKLAKRYPSHTALCIRDGWDFCGPEEASDSTMQFLVEKWRDHLPPGYLLKKASVDPPFEEDACRCHFVFLKDHSVYDEAELVLKYQWFIGDKTPTNFEIIEGAVTEVYWPKHEEIDKFLKVECTPVLRGSAYPPIFAVSSPIATGTGCPKVLNLKVEGELIEGNLIRGFAEVAWCGGTPGKGVASWLRRRWNSSPVVIIGAEEEEYRLTFDDVDSSLVFMYTPVTEEGAKGEPQYAMTDYVKAAFPSVTNLRVVGDLVAGKTIKGIGTYFGGNEGPSKFEWLREDKDSGEFVLVSRGAAEYTLTEEDVGLSMVFVYTPVNLEGQEGTPATAATGKVLHAPPRVAQLRIVGDVREGNKVAISAMVRGRVEGASRVQWFKTTSADLEPDESGMEAISTSRIAKAFRIPLAAVGYYLVAKYTPVAQDGECGEPALVISDKRVETLPPSLNFLSITGDFSEGEVLTASYGYIGGHEGSSDYNWYLHESENEFGTLIPESTGQLQYQITKNAVNKFVSFKCLPIRDDGVIGEVRTTMSHERVQPGSPRILSLQIVGDCVEGAELHADKIYWGGDEGASKLQWFLTSPDGTQHEIKGATSTSYTVHKEDIDGLICVSCEPIRMDGARGAIVKSQCIGPILPGPPSCESLQLHGQSVEGGCLSFSVVYKGGEKGSCIHEWVRQNSSGVLYKISNDEVLDLTCEDVGSRIELVFTPVRKDGSIGKSQRVISDVVSDAEPMGIGLVIPDCSEDKEVVPQKSYYGGREGGGQYTWYRITQELNDKELLDACNGSENVNALATSTAYIPKLEDVGAYLAVRWVPSRKDGRLGRALVARSRLPVAPAPPAVCNVRIEESSSGVYVGEGKYYGGLEGNSQFSWYRETEDGTMSQIRGAKSKCYEVTDDDYTCRLLFGYTPVRSDGVMGELCLSEPGNMILPEMPKVQKLVLTGKAVEGEILTAVEVIPKGESQQRIWEKYKKEVKYQWSRSESGDSQTFEALLIQRSCSYKVRLEDVGCWLQCECVVSDIFDRSSEHVSAISGPVSPGAPRVDKLEIEGRGYHTNLYAVRGIYSGGKEGKSKIQWLRSMVGSPDLISIPGEVGRMYEANVDDVGYRLVAVYTPVREDGMEGTPVSTSTEPIAVEPEVLKEVKQKLELGAVKFEALRDRDRSPMKSQMQGLGSLERRILDVNRKRIKVVKPGSKTSFPNTEIRGTYAPPFHVELFRNDQHRLKIVIDSENEVDLM
ncbi:hypothetical protein KI387_032350, partial [Taxus chinensis]